MGTATKQRKTLEFGINPFRFVGISYVKRMYALRSDPRPTLTIHLLFFVIWLRLPWSDIASKSYGAGVCSYGFVVRLSPFYFHINKGI